MPAERVEVAAEPRVTLETIGNGKRIPTRRIYSRHWEDDFHWFGCITVQCSVRIIKFFIIEINKIDTSDFGAEDISINRYLSVITRMRGVRRHLRNV